jgi:hypothetical protein
LKLGLRSAAADALIGVVVREGHLPLGLHTSPTIANAMCHELDFKLVALVPGGRYTRYADDLTFSGPHLPTQNALVEILAEFGFALALDKCSVLRSGRGLYVTGLSIEDGRAPRVPRAIKRRIRQELYYSKKLTLDTHIGHRYGSMQSGINYIHGTIQFIRGIERELGNNLHSSWTQLLEQAGYDTAFVSLGPQADREVFLVIDESKIARPAGDVLALALIVIEDPVLIAGYLREFIDNCMAQPFSSTSAVTLAEEGLHWNSLTPDDRTRITQLVSHLPFRGFIAYAQLVAEDRKTYTTKYKELLTKLISKRLVRYDHATIKIFAEENSKVISGSLSEVVAGAYHDLERLDSRRPKQCPQCFVVGKTEEPTLPLADLVLGIFGDFARIQLLTKPDQKQKTAPGAQAAQRFAAIRNKVRAIYDLDDGIVYSRRRSFEPWSRTT